MLASSLKRPTKTQADTEVALALCNLGCDVLGSNGRYGSAHPTASLDNLAEAACSKQPYIYLGSSHAVSPSSAVSLSRQPQRPLPFPAIPQQASITTISNPSLSHAVPQVPVHKANHLDISARRAKKNDTTNLKRRTKNQDTSVTFEEMTRLMNTYGPIKCLRNRSSKNQNKEIKAASILRKFYRWFPDFEERFVKISDGRYIPKIGHEKEIKYREMMRDKDEKYVISKRNFRRYSSDVI